MRVVSKGLETAIMAKKSAYQFGENADETPERGTAVPPAVQGQEKKTLDFLSTSPVSSDKGVQPKPKSRPLSRRPRRYTRTEITPPFNYHALGEKIAQEGLTLSVHPVCQDNLEIAGKVEKLYSAASGLLETTEKLITTQKWVGNESGLAGIASDSLYNGIYKMEKVYGIPSVPVLREAYAALRKRSQTLLGLESTEEDLNPRF